ncbi:peroxisomal biogenesis factor 19-like [Dendronephthya gigantea]|uniref:peroxisomal biogenesis factor 19-like n=1 Tax=Dendronephthya gigantea TaxID=151771 RepID=UPI00106CE4BC|nr:peroxisomal biogenesis factor 19-like [Dendronephthya gigantea]
MAAKGETSDAPSKDDDEDDLDALLDSALEDFENLPSCKSSINKSEPSKTKDSASCLNHTQEPSFDNWGLGESDIEATAAEFEKSMKEILGDDNELLKQWNEFAENAAFSNPDMPNNENESLPQNAEEFEAHLLKTMKNIAENAKEMSSTPGMDENFLKAMADMGVDGQDPDLNQEIFPMMQGMMMNLLSKDVLYPALNDLRAKYPGWLEEKKGTLPSNVHENYSKQYELVCQICSEYDQESEKDSVEIKKKRFDKLMGLMQKMQKYGQPPQELVGNGVQGQGPYGENFQPDKCPVM